MRILMPAIILFWALGFNSQNGKPRKIIVIAHRGANRFAPENTLAAFKKAIELGCDYVELDVRRTKDGKLILMHDRTVDGKTNGHGAVEDMTLDEIGALDAGIKRGSEWAGTKVPTFEEALAVCRGKIKVYVDNKACPVDEVLAAIEKHKMLQQVMIYVDPEHLRQFKHQPPNVWLM